MTKRFEEILRLAKEGNGWDMLYGISGSRISNRISLNPEELKIVLDAYIDVGLEKQLMAKKGDINEYDVKRLILLGKPESYFDFAQVLRIFISPPSYNFSAILAGVEKHKREKPFVYGC